MVPIPAGSLGLQCIAEAVGAPWTLGYSSPEVMAHGHCQDPANPLGPHKADIHAVAVMTLLWLNPGANMPFGPTREQLANMGSPEGVAKAKKTVMRNFQAWVSLSTLS